MIPHCDHARADSRLDRPQRQVELRCELGLRVPVEKRLLDQQALLFRDSPQRRHNRALLLGLRRTEGLGWEMPAAGATAAAALLFKQSFGDAFVAGVAGLLIAARAVPWRRTSTGTQSMNSRIATACATQVVCCSGFIRMASVTPLGHG